MSMTAAELTSTSTSTSEEQQEEKKRARDENPNPLWKTTLCSYFRRDSKSCDHGDECRYAHGEAELRPRPDDSWDPTSDRAKKILKMTTINEEEEEEEEEGCNEDSLEKCMVGVPRGWTSDKFKSFLAQHNLLYGSAKKKKGMAVAFLTFHSPDQLRTAIQEFNNNKVGGKGMKIADVVVRTSSNKPKQCETADDIDDCEGLAVKKRHARDVVTPLAHLPYPQQLDHKTNSLSQTLKRLTRNARKACPTSLSLPQWIQNSREIGGLPCKLEGILQSPLTVGYRNKCEFSVGYSVDGKKTVGFVIGNFREGVTAVEEPVDCPNVSAISCQYATIFQEFLQSSELPIWNRTNNAGFWRQFTVREGREPSKFDENVENQVAEVMLIVQVCSTSVDKEVMDAEFKKMTEHIVQAANTCSPSLPLTALVIQDHTGISNVAPADCPLFPLPVPKIGKASGTQTELGAEARINDYICNLRFCISPTAFFQVNTLAAEKLYSLAGDWAGLSPDTLLFDICCGTGTIGLTLAHRVGMVVGIEMNNSAVSDAIRNADINDIKNCRFICAKAEDVIGALLKEYLDVPEYKGPNTSSHGSQTTEIDNHHSNECNDGEMLASGSHVYTDANNSEKNLCDSTIDKNIEIQDVSQGKVDEHVGNNLGNHDEASTVIENLPSDGTKSSLCCQEETAELSKKVNGDNHVFGKQRIGGPNLQFKDVVAIVDPPRVGLHPVVIKALRTHPCIRRLVYISCNPDSLVANAIELCTPTVEKTEKVKNNNRWRSMSSAGLARHRVKSMPDSEPFRPVRAMAVDLFPHTPHCEMVMLFER